MPSLRAAPHIPTSSRAGGESPTLLRGKNLMLRGRRPDRLYLEVYSGSKNLNEDIPEAALTGTLSLTAGDKVINGTGTAFKSELHIGQQVLVNGEVVVVDKVMSDIVFRSVAPALATASGQTGYRPPVLFEIDEQRGSLIWGNALQFDKGTILGVGQGTLRINGSALPGTSFTAARTPKIAVYDPSTGNYGVYSLGMATPAAHSLAGVAGGVKNMAAGTYSILLVPARTATKGSNNPSVKVSVTITAGQKIRITFVAMDTSKGQDSWRAYGSLFTGNQSIQGPWYYVQTITSTDLGGTGAGTTFDIEWLDAEISRNELLEFDNFPPPECEFIASLGGNPVYVSCLGKTGGSPGANLVPVKPRNVEAALLDINLRLDPAHTIVGWLVAEGRLYLPTTNSLQIGVLQTIADFPITTRPFWKLGLRNPYSVIFVNGRLWGWTESGPTRSAFDGEEGSEEFELAADVWELASRWMDGKVYVVEDVVNETVCFVHAADALNSSGWWTSVVLPYSLRHECWMLPVVLDSSSGDMIVSGVATVNNRFYFIAGGRQQAGGRTWRTYEFDAGAGVAVPYYAAWAYQDEGAEDRDKEVGAIRVTAKITNGTAGIHGAEADDDVDIAVLEAGNSGSKSGSISLGTTANVHRGDRIELNLPGLALYTARVDGTWSGTGARDRIDEVFLEVGIGTMRR